MKIVKMNVGIRQGKRAKYRTSLFLCPVCGKTVERITASGIRSKACSVRCTSKMGGNKFHANICAECAVDNCRWLLKAKPVKGWKAKRIEYKPNEPDSPLHKTYHITYCPKFKKV